MTAPPAADRRLLLVHAHPDDETITCGVTMAGYAAAGARVTLVTCTLGEMGEVLVPNLEHLAADRDDTLGEHRLTELGAAMAALGVADWRVLGGPGTFRDSGMMGTAANEDPRCFWRADLLSAAEHLVPIIREVRPQVLVTYDDFGGYGHPDHIQAHRVAMYAAALAEARTFRLDLGEPWQVAKVYWCAMPKSAVRTGIAKLRELGEDTGFAAMDPDDLPFAVDDDLVTTQIAGPEHVPAKVEAMRAHATQISLEGGFFALSNQLGQEVFAVEHFRLARGPFAPDASGRETDLFAGL
jgi:N-acetyl-1-D-myo-inositol-2-amino-2-deoxy-alpha-D-glucopyranoside deacetylase